MAKKVKEEEVPKEVVKEYKLSYPKVIKKIKFKTYNQKRFYKAIEHPNHNIIMGHALAGAGKTYISIQKGLELLLHRLSHIEKLIIINPTVDVGSTRISDDAKLIIEGDLSQCDKYKNNGSPAYTKSGFFDVWKRLGKLKGVYQIEFTKEDCIRSGIVKRVLERYELEEEIYLGENNQYELDFSFNPFPDEEVVENEEVITN